MGDRKYSKEDKFEYTYKFINDPVYGSIGISKVEAGVIDTPAFQRLRHLRQLGFSSYVFPGGEHSRFVHSLGVLSIMGKMCHHLQTCYSDDFDRQDTFIMRIAALLHDIGHYPLSHLGEFVYCYNAELADKEHDMSEDDDMWGVKRKSTTEAKSTEEATVNRPLLFDMATRVKFKKAHHEKLGEIVVVHNASISSILRNCGLRPEDVANIFTRGVGKPENTIYYNLLHSSLDADRLDYLLRDSTQTGVKFGLVDLDYLIRLLMISKQEIDYNGEKITVRMIAYNKKGQHVIEHFAMCRYFHYAQVVNHKTSGAFEMLAKVVFCKLLERESCFVDFKGLFEKQANGEWFVNTEQFLHFTDEEWWHYAFGYRQISEDDLYNVCYDSLLNRIPPKSLYVSRDIQSYSKNYSFSSSKKETIYLRKRSIIRFLPEIASELGIDENRIGYTLNESTIEKDAHKFSGEILDVLNEEMTDCIKVSDPSQKDECMVLAKDETSLLGNISDLYSESINVFYIFTEEELGKLDDFAIENIKNRFRMALDKR